MGLRLLVGTYNATNHAAVMVDSASGWPTGPVFEAEDAEEQIEAFIEWLSRQDAYELVERLEIEPDQHPGMKSRDGRDPRDWTDAALGKIVTAWRLEHVGDDGFLAGQSTGQEEA